MEEIAGNGNDVASVGKPKLKRSIGLRMATSLVQQAASRLPTEQAVLERLVGGAAL
jgi:hypothetical protein